MTDNLGSMIAYDHGRRLRRTGDSLWNTVSSVNVEHDVFGIAP